MSQLVAALETRSHEYDTILLAGRRLGMVAKIDGYLTWGELGGTRCAVVPHPSNLNKFWNSKRNAKQVRRFLEGEVLSG